MKSTIQLELNNQYKGLHAPLDALCALVQTIENSGLFPIQSGELSLAFVDDKTLANIHADFMDDPSPTDVITFPAEPTMQSAGEILISVDRAIEQAHRQGAPLSHELSLYLVHGWLHLGEIVIFHKAFLIELWDVQCQKHPIDLLPVAFACRYFQLYAF